MSKENMSRDPDDLEATRIITEALKHFDTNEQERIIRWAQEKLGLSSFSQLPRREMHREGDPPHLPPHKRPVSDIKTFVSEKNPTSDTHFATTVAYYYKFESLETNRKDVISADDLQDACRTTGRKRLQDPGQTLRNAHQGGLLDKAGERGFYAVNTVGENLVAMTLPGSAPQKTNQRKQITKKSKRVKIKKSTSK